MSKYYWQRNENTGCPNASANPSAVATSPDGDWMLAGSGTDIWISGDMGLNWLRYSSGSSKASKAACIAEDAAYMFLASDDGATGEIRRSTDQGASWSVVGNAARYVSICCSDSGRYVFAAHTAGIQVSSDYGATFAAVTTPFRTIATFDGATTGVNDTIRCSSATYADARSGAGTKTDLGDATCLWVGQQLTGGTYNVWQAGCSWDTSSLADDLTIVGAYLHLRLATDASATDFVLEARNYDHGGMLDTGDFRSGDSLGGYTLLASENTSRWNDGTEYWRLVASANELASIINKTGNTRLWLSSSRQRTNNAPVGDEYVKLYGATAGAKPRLCVEYLSSGGFWQIACSDDGRYVYASQTSGDYIARSSDYGATWTHVIPDLANGADGGAFYRYVAGGGLCCSGDGQTVIRGPGQAVNNRLTRKSTDGGATWANSGSMVGGNYNSGTQLAMSGDGTKVVATSHGGGGVAGVNWSTDGGATFTTEGNSTYTHYGASISRDGLSGCVPSNGSHNDCHVMTREVSNSALKTIWACGDAGKIYRSNDGGHSWSAQTSGTTEALKGISAYDKDNALCCGDNGIILYTHDGGATWTASADTDVTDTANDWTDVFMATPLIGWAVSYAGRIVKTTDGGVTWAIQQPDQSSKRLYCVDGTPDEVNIVMAAGPGWSGGANVLRTANGGTNWGEVACGGSYGMGCVDIHNALAVCCKQSSTSTGYKSTDSGASFASFSGNGNGAQRETAVYSGSGWRGRHHTWKGAVAGDNRGFCSHAGLGTIGTAKLQYAGYYSLISVNLGTFYHSHAGGLGWEEPIVIAAGITLNDVWGEEEWFEWGEDLSIVVNDGAASTDDNDVHLDIHASASAQGANVPISQMCFSTDGATWSDWEAYATTRAYQLPPQSDEDAHVITVYVKFRATSEGTTYTSDAVSDAITLQIDWTDLSVYLEVVTLNDGMPVAGVTEVPLTFGGTSSAGDVVQYCYAIDGGAAVAWGTYVPDLSRPYHPMSITVELGTTGEHYVDVYLKDDDDNTLLIGRDDVLITDKTTIDYTRPFGVIPVRMYADSSQVRKMSHDIEAPNLLPVRIPTSAKRRR